MREFIHKLDKKNFFYELVTLLAYTQFGVNELFNRGFIIKAKSKYRIPVDFYDYIDSRGFPNDVIQQIYNYKTFTPLIFVPGFTTKDKQRTYEFNPNQSAIEYLNDTGGISPANWILTYMTIISAFVKIDGLNLSGPTYEFFRHLRNAAAHNGKFKIGEKVINKDGELQKPAKWRNFEIKASYNDMELILKHKEDTEAFFDQGDLVEFLLDFENHYPEIKLK